MMNAESFARHKWISFALVLLLCMGMYAVSRHNYLLFHTVSEIFSIVIACGIFMVAWNSRQFTENNYLLLLGIAYLFIGIIDLGHTLSYKGMGIFVSHGSNFSTQLWISARYMEAISLFVAPFFLKRKIRIGAVIVTYSLVTVLVFLSVFIFQSFPDCFIEGQGLTPFKKISEYAISVIFCSTIAVMYHRRDELDTTVFNLVVASIIITIFAEIMFTFYISVFGFSNLIGHLLKFVSFVLIYKAMIETGLKRPYALLFRDLKKSEKKLLEHQDHLEKLVTQRTQDLVTVNEKLKQDLIKRKKLEGQLRQAYKMESIGTLAGGIAHDFNNILASVMGFTELAMAQAKKGSMIYQDLSQVLLAVNRAKELVHQILTFSRQGETEIRPVLVRPLIKEVLKLIRASLSSSIRFEQKLIGDPLIMADSTQILQVLMNLCTNAGHAMKESGGRILVELESIEIDKAFSAVLPDIKPGPYVLLNVSDTGCGMTDDVKQQIFDPFYTTKNRGEGTGMGLSVVYGIVSSFGGAIDVYSEPGKGTSFKLLFPAIERRVETDEREVVPLPGGEEYILFVDAEPSICQINKKILQSLGYKVTVCASSIEALDLFQDQKDLIDLVIADISMPNMTGLQLAEKMIGIKPQIPIILYSGFRLKIHERSKHIKIIFWSRINNSRHRSWIVFELEIECIWHS